MLNNSFTDSIINFVGCNYLKGFQFEYNSISSHYIGDFDKVCKYCQSINFATESTNNEFTSCCNKGAIFIPNLVNIPEYVKNYFTKVSKDSKNFLENIRNYNSALAFASMAANFDSKMHQKGPYFFKISGQVYHYTSNTLYP